MVTAIPKDLVTWRTQLIGQNTTMESESLTFFALLS